MSRRPGYALVEVIMAVMIFSLVGIGMARAIEEMGGLVRNVQTGDYLRERLRGQIDLIKAERQKQGTFNIKEDDAGVSFEVKVEPFECRNMDEEPVQGIFWIEVTLRWKQGRDLTERTAGFYYYQP
jgi:type II secretory pathway component PulJ